MTLPATKPPRWSQTKRIHELLKDGKPHSAAEIHAICGSSRLNSRISELRKRGMVIECQHVGGSGPAAYVYRLISDEPLSERAPNHSPGDSPGFSAGVGEVDARARSENGPSPQAGAASPPVTPRPLPQLAWWEDNGLWSVRA